MTCWMYQNSILPRINYPLLKKELSNYSTQCPVSHEFHTFWYCVNIEPVSQTFSYVLCSNSGSFLIFMCVHYSAKYSMVACEDHWGSLSCSVISSALSCNVYFPWFYLTSSFSTSSQGVMVGTTPVSSPGVLSCPGSLGTKRAGTLGRLPSLLVRFHCLKSIFSKII
jgi:hypothetical protein